MRRVFHTLPFTPILWSGIAAVVAGVVTVAPVLVEPQAGLGISYLSGSLDTVVVLLLNIVALLGQLAGIAGLHALQRECYGRLGTVGFLITFVGFVLQLISILGISLSSNIIFASLFGVGVLLPFVGLALLGAATLRARMLPRWVGVVLMVGYVVAATLVVAWEANIGMIVYGIFWVLVGVALLLDGRVQG